MGLTELSIRQLVSWYKRHHRTLPWRTTRDPYVIWVSEILLQQTQVETVRPYFLRFIAAFPTVEALAQAPLDDVLKAWEGCGYYARARNLHRAAKMVCERGSFPISAADWRTLPGIGAYSSAAIASIVSGEAIPVIDGNVERVIARVLAERRIIKSAVALKRVKRTVESAMQAATAQRIKPGDFNQALMELGARICKPRKADCGRCPLQPDCRAAATMADVTVLPRKIKAKALPHYPIGAAIICKGDKLLITQRPLEGMLGGLWEFPGGKQDAGESLEECVAREIREELGLEITVGEHFASVKHSYSHFQITLHCYLCTLKSGRIKKIGVADYRWITRSELTDFAFPKADRVIIEKLLSGVR
jgi:A/G-specific adenine glycosylase